MWDEFADACFVIPRLSALCSFPTLACAVHRQLFGEVLGHINVRGKPHPAEAGKETLMPDRRRTAPRSADGQRVARHGGGGLSS